MECVGVTHRVLSDEDFVDRIEEPALAPVVVR